MRAFAHAIATTLEDIAGPTTRRRHRLVSLVSVTRKTEIQRMPSRYDVATCASDAAAILVVDDDPTTLETISQLLRLRGMRVQHASSGTQALMAARTQAFDLALIDCRLPDMSGLDVVSALRAESRCMPWILMSGFMDFEMALRAGRLGALQAVSAPFDVESVVAAALVRIRAHAAGWPTVPLGDRLIERGSAAKRAAYLLLKTCDSIDDLHTLGEWAAFVGVSYTQLRDNFYRIGMQPNDARGLMRVLRALVRRNGIIAGVQAELDTGDYRTDDHLLTAAGLSEGVERLTPGEFLNRQRFVDANHPLVAELRALLDRLSH